MFVIYQNGLEIFITTPDLEKAMLDHFFVGERDRYTYDRTVLRNLAICVTLGLQAR